ncbi:MAG: amino acid permease [Chitinophagales bacterium]|nr:amino acid permease [Chitinophagales bacterium]
MPTQKLKRTLGLAECVFFGVGSILGAGIYALVGKVAGFGGNMIWLAFLIASVTALLSAFSYAEMSAAFPKAGGEYVYAKNALGKKAGIILGFIISLNGIISGATVSLGFAGYFTRLIELPLLAVAPGILVLVFLVNISGIRQSSIINIIFTVIETGGLLFVIYAAFPDLGKVDYLELPPSGFNGVLAAAALSYFAYLGFEEIVKLAEETKKPEKNIPKALFIASAIVMVVYTLVAICAVSAIPWQELSESDSPLADIVSNRFGKTGALVIVIIALFSTSNTILSNMMGSSRVILSMAKEVSFMKWFSWVWASRQTPVPALLLILLVTSAFSLIGKIETVALIANFSIFITFLLVNTSVIVLRITNKNLKRPFRIPGNIKNIPVISVCAILLTLLLTAYTIYGLLNT